MKSAKHYWQQAERRAADANLLFLEFVKEGMTREQLERLIALRPSLWGRFSIWLDRLPSDTYGQASLFERDAVTSSA